MSALTRWVRSRKATASALAIVLIAGVPLTIAALHPGFPISDVQLESRDVWVTNGQQLLGGRLNRQIDELNGAVVAASPHFDVLQDGDTLFMVDPDNGRVEAVSPATTEVTSAIDIPKGAAVTYGKNRLVVVSPAGDLWVVSTVDGDLKFNFASTEPLIKLGSGGKAIVTADGVVIAVSPSHKSIYRLEPGPNGVTTKSFPKVGDFELSSVGDGAVVLDRSTNELIKEDGSSIDLGDQVALRLQQVGATAPFALVATGDALLRVTLANGAIDRIPANIDTPVKGDKAASAPVYLNGCANGAWAAAQTYLLACDGAASKVSKIPKATQGDIVEFRVNRSVIALNNLSNGNVWLVDENMRLVENWADVTPPEDTETDEGDEKSATQSFEDTLAERTEQNRPPVANDDVLGARPGRTTILNVLDNDTDPDGDVLVITNTDPIAESSGHIDYIDGGRSLQYTPAEGYSGTVAFSYSVSDGRTGGTAQARVELNVRPFEVNEPPVQVRQAGVSLEPGQTANYNVLADWKDPDGDDLTLANASPKSGDLVRYTPDGFVTFTHQTSEGGAKEVVYGVTDGNSEVQQGTLDVNVEAPGSLDPIGTPDYAASFAGQAVVVEPLANDTSPSGAQLVLQGIEPPDGVTATINSDLGSVSFSASQPGTYYTKYTLGAGSKSSVGIIRLDVSPPPVTEFPPIAVKDIAYLRGDTPSTVSVLTNDVSPSGRVLAVQSVEVPQDLLTKGLVVETLESTLIRVTSPAALTGQAQFSYTISDGTNTSVATVSIVPVPPLTTHQAPIAANDAVKVRAGDIVSVNVLANDFHPDDSPMFLDRSLVSEPSAGLAFVSGNQVRFQAPSKPGEYRADYRVLDPFGESSAATVVFTVTADDKKGNQDPVPAPIIARVLAGGQIKVDLPLNGVDPDGDSVQLLTFPTNPALGVVTSFDATSFTYEASKLSAGTDQFQYEVVDAYGATGVGDIRVAVIPEPKTNQNPNAVPDSVLVRPGRVAQVQLTANDSDPQSSPIKVSSKLIDVPAGISVKVVDKQYALIQAPDKVMSFSFRYELTNDRGGRSISYVQVQVDPKAPLLPPSASDYVVPTAAIAGKKSLQIDLFPDYAFNPSGPTDDLDVTFLGPNAKLAEALSKPGVIKVTPGPVRQAIAYEVTNKKDKLSAFAFIIVPAAVGEEFDDPPMIDPNLPQQYIPMNSTGTWDLKDIVVAPSGRDVIITNKSTVTGVQGTGDSFVDKDTITLTPPKDYRGPAAIIFQVTDGASADDPKGNKATLRLPIIVGDPEFKDTPPVFTPPSVNLEPGEPVTIDLRDSTQHPNPSILQQVTYSDVTVSGTGLTQSLDGSKLTLSVPRNATKGKTYTVGVTLRWDKFVVPGTINVTVVASSKPLAVAVEDDVKAQRGGATVSVPVLANDSNPFQTTGEPLKVIDAHLETDGGSQSSAAIVSFTGTSVSVKPGPGYIGDVTVVYVVQDATEDSDRNVNGRVVVTVRDVPDAPAAPSATGNDAAVYVAITAPNTSNGEPVDSYELTYSGTHWNGAGSGTQSGTSGSCAPPGCTIAGLNNGWSYNFAVRAHNMLGWSGWSTSSNTAIPYGTPGAVTGLGVTNSSGYAPATVTWSWGAPTGTTGQTTYAWSLSGPNPQSGTTASTSIAVGGLSAGTHTMTVTASNPGPKTGPPATAAGYGVSNAPPPPPTITLSRGAFEPTTSNGYHYHVVLSGFSGNIGLVCYHQGGQAITGTVYQRSNGSYDLPCYSGYGNYYVTGNPGGYYSNTVGAWP